MRRLTAVLAASGMAALAVTGAGMAGKPVLNTTLNACFDQQGQIVASIAWDGGRVTHGTFVAGDYDQAVPDSIVQWQLVHGAKSGTRTESLGPNLGYELVIGRLYAGQKELATRHFDVSAMTSC